jgi:hypothetical protein
VDVGGLVVTVGHVIGFVIFRATITSKGAKLGDITFPATAAQLLAARVLQLGAATFTYRINLVIVILAHRNGFGIVRSIGFAVRATTTSHGAKLGDITFPATAAQLLATRVLQHGTATFTVLVSLVIVILALHIRGRSVLVC